MTKLMMEAGRNDLVFTWANKTDFPSYGHFLKLGYTTWPEQWDIKSGQSLMHGCYNAIGLWFVEGVAGIRVHASESPPLVRGKKVQCLARSPFRVYSAPFAQLA